ncbi:MAG: ASCH domain-containing protein, partial [Oscillospiraceae bacterium]|nr:ASCH domain-containing protein [Oscillospiraceae bacterium]
YTLYELDGEPLPKEGAYSVVLDSADRAVCVIQTTRVYVTPFSQVSAEHAFKEGEGDKSLDYWRQVHRDFFIGELAAYGLTFDESMPVVCEEFVCLYPNHK